MKKLLLILMLVLGASSMGAQSFTDAKYLAGAVPEENGFVVFKKSYNCTGIDKATIYTALEEYSKSLLKSDVHLAQCRLTQATQEDGVVAASMEETLTFKSTAWILDTARFFYQLVFEAHEGGFDVTLRRIHYIYEPMTDGSVPTALSAEDWITDREALNKRGQLTKVGGKKFRFATINRKDAIFDGAYTAVMGQK